MEGEKKNFKDHKLFFLIKRTVDVKHFCEKTTRVVLTCLDEQITD